MPGTVTLAELFKAVAVAVVADAASSAVRAVLARKWRAAVRDDLTLSELMRRNAKSKGDLEIAEELRARAFKRAEASVFPTHHIRSCLWRFYSTAPAVSVGAAILLASGVIGGAGAFSLPGYGLALLLCALSDALSYRLKKKAERENKLAREREEDARDDDVERYEP